MTIDQPPQVDASTPDALFVDSTPVQDVTPHGSGQGVGIGTLVGMVTSSPND